MKSHACLNFLSLSNYFAIYQVLESQPSRDSAAKNKYLPRPDCTRL